MNLYAALEAAKAAPIKKGPTCTMGTSLANMPPETRAKLVEILTTPKPDGQMVSATIISDILNQYGWPVRRDAVMRHRRRLLGKHNGCACRGPE